jgi:hypothetical protein
VEIVIILKILRETIIIMVKESYIKHYNKGNIRYLAVAIKVIIV